MLSRLLCGRESMKSLIISYKSFSSASLNLSISALISSFVVISYLLYRSAGSACTHIISYPHRARLLGFGPPGRREELYPKRPREVEADHDGVQEGPEAERDE